MQVKTTVPKKIFKILCSLPAIGNDMEIPLFSKKLYTLDIEIEKIVSNCRVSLFFFWYKGGYFYMGYFKNGKHEYMFLLDKKPKSKSELELYEKKGLPVTIIPGILFTFELDSPKFDTTPKLGILKNPALQKISWLIIKIFKDLASYEKIQSVEDKKNWYDQQTKFGQCISKLLTDEDIEFEEIEESDQEIRDAIQIGFEKIRDVFKKETGQSIRVENGNKKDKVEVLVSWIFSVMGSIRTLCITLIYCIDIPCKIIQNFPICQKMFVVQPRERRSINRRLSEPEKTNKKRKLKFG